MTRQVERRAPAWATPRGCAPGRTEPPPTSLGGARGCGPASGPRPADHRPDRRRRLGQPAGSRLSIQKPASASNWPVGAVGMATAARSPRALQPVLPPGGPARCSDVLEEEELASLDQHPAGLGQGPRRFSTVQSTSVETTVSKLSSSNGRSSAGASTTSTRSAAPARGEPLPQAPGHVRVGLGQHQLGDLAGVVLEVAAGAARRAPAPGRRRGEQRAASRPAPAAPLPRP